MSLDEFTLGLRSIAEEQNLRVFVVEADQTSISCCTYRSYNRKISE